MRACNATYICKKYHYLLPLSLQTRVDVNCNNYQRYATSHISAKMQNKILLLTTDVIDGYKVMYEKLIKSLSLVRAKDYHNNKLLTFYKNGTKEV